MQRLGVDSGGGGLPCEGHACPNSPRFSASGAQHSVQTERVRARSPHVPYIQGVHCVWGLPMRRSLAQMSAALSRARFSTPPGPGPALVTQLAPTGTLRAAFNMRNALLISGRTPAGDPDGVAPDLARELALRLGVPLAFVGFASPAEVADSARDGVWDLCFLGAEPARATHVAFTPAYVEIESTYLVPAGSACRTADDVDRPGVRIAVARGSAYDLYLTRHLRHAALVHADGLDASVDVFVNEGLEALAGLKPRLLSDVQKLPGPAFPIDHHAYEAESGRDPLTCPKRPRCRRKIASKRGSQARAPRAPPFWVLPPSLCKPPPCNVPPPTRETVTSMFF